MSGRMFQAQTVIALLGRRQRTSLHILSLQNIPVNFDLAAISKDSAHSRAKLTNDRSKLSLPPLHPGQSVLLQNPKTSAWDCLGSIVSVRPDGLSYIVNSENRSYLRPRRLLWPVILENTNQQVRVPARVTTPALCHSPCLHSCASTSMHQSSLFPTPTPQQLIQWAALSQPWTTLLTWMPLMANGPGTLHLPPLLPFPSSFMMRPTCQTIMKSQWNQRTSTSTKAITDSHLLISTGRASLPAYPQCSPSLWPSPSSLDAATLRVGASANHSPNIQSSFGQSSLMPPAMSAPALMCNQAPTQSLSGLFSRPPPPHPSPVLSSNQPLIPYSPTSTPLFVYRRPPPHVAFQAVPPPTPRPQLSFTPPLSRRPSMQSPMTMPPTVLLSSS